MCLHAAPAESPAFLRRPRRPEPACLHVPAASGGQVGRSPSMLRWFTVTSYARSSGKKARVDLLPPLSCGNTATKECHVLPPEVTGAWGASRPPLLYCGRAGQLGGGQQVGIADARAWGQHRRDGSVGGQASPRPGWAEEGDDRPLEPTRITSMLCSASRFRPGATVGRDAGCAGRSRRPPAVSLCCPGAGRQRPCQPPPPGTPPAHPPPAGGPLWVPLTGPAGPLPHEGPRDQRPLQPWAASGTPRVVFPACPLQGLALPGGRRASRVSQGGCHCSLSRRKSGSRSELPRLSGVRVPEEKAMEPGHSLPACRSRQDHVQGWGSWE